MDKQIKEFLSDFLFVISSVTGVYFNSIGGFNLCLKELTDQQAGQIKFLRRTQPEKASFDYLDSLPVKYCEGNPNFPSANIFFETTAGDYKTRNSPAGLNHRVIGNMCIVIIYQYWEDHFRPEIARLLGINISDITSDIMGDIRYLRNSIIHHSSVALKEIENTKILRWYKEGDEIFINEDQYKFIISHVQSYIDSFI